MGLGNDLIGDTRFLWGLMFPVSASLILLIILIVVIVRRMRKRREHELLLDLTYPPVIPAEAITINMPPEHFVKGDKEETGGKKDTVESAAAVPLPPSPVSGDLKSGSDSGPPKVATETV